MRKKRTILKYRVPAAALLAAVLLAAALFVSGCSGDDSSGKTPTTSGTTAENGSPPQGGGEEQESENHDPSAPVRDNTPQVLTPEAGGDTYGSDTVTMDLSNTGKGYMILTYVGSNDKVKFQSVGPDGVTYTYLVTARGEPIVYPLTGGSGTYTFNLLEAVDVEKDLYAMAFTKEADVALEDEFLPYLTPNVYSSYTADSAAVAEGVTLAEGCTSDLEVVENIYHYVIGNVTYDTPKAENIAYGYIPNVDDTLSTKKGICFDYAALMTAMLRTQRIPTRLEVGYAGEAYHAWISCYLTEVGWVDKIIEFDGKSWSLMDPTLASNNDRQDVQQYVGDGSSYIVKYTY